jgi:hypothetical protein
MHKWTKKLGLIATFIAFNTSLPAQSLYLSGNNTGPGDDAYILGIYNIETCTFCPEFTLPSSMFPSGMEDVVPLPDGQVVVVGKPNIIRVYDPPGNTPLASLLLPGVNMTGGVLAPNGNVYVTGGVNVNGVWDPKVYEYNVVTNTSTVVGTLSAPSNQVLIQPFYWNGLLHAFMSDLTNNSKDLVTIDLGNPMSINIVSNFGSGPLCGAPAASITSGPFAGIYQGVLDPDCTGYDLYELELPSNTTAFVCETLPSGYPYGLGEVPTGYPSSSCLCFTDAGTVPTPSQSLCADEVLIFSESGGFLEGGDARQYILFTNPNDTAGSIVATANTPSFELAPPLEAGVAYYFAAIAGDELNGNVDLNDPCLDFSNANTVIWRSLPTVVLSVTNPDVCPGNCTAVTATFTGTPPFTLTYTAPGLGPVTQTFPGNTGSFQVCVPANAPLGGLVVEATSLADGFCSCQ